MGDAPVEFIRHAIDNDLRALLTAALQERDEALVKLEAKHVHLQLQIGLATAYKAQRDRLRAALAPTAAFGSYVSGIGAINAGVITVEEGWARLLAAVRARAGLP